MIERTKEARLKKRWWFLAKGFQRFKKDSVAQGYEIICRHPGFASSAPANVLNLALAPPWPRLNKKTRESFYFTFKHDLSRMGLAKISYLGPKAVTFKCTESSDSILAAIRYETGRLSRLKPGMRRDFPTALKKHDRARTDAALLCFQPSKTNPEMVTLNWRLLIRHFQKRRRYGKPVPFSVEHVLSAVETYLTKNRDYQSHVKQVKARLSAKVRPEIHCRPKKAQAEVIAFGCIAHDWLEVDQSLTGLFPFCEVSLLDLGIRRGNRPPRWDNWLAALAKLHSRVKLHTPKRIAPITPFLGGPELVSILYPP